MAKSGAKFQENVAVNSNFHRPSAKIYQFPVQTRESPERRKLAQQASGAYYISKPNEIMVTGAWYHDAAIKEDDRGRKG
jgi:hypothetical protein